MSHTIIDNNLSFILDEMKTQPGVAHSYSADELQYVEHMEQIREFIVDAGEYGLAYEYIVVALQSLPFMLSGKASVKLLEVGLLMRFKSEMEDDKNFDMRSPR